jgi:hypothetical protein
MQKLLSIFIIIFLHLVTHSVFAQSAKDSSTVNQLKDTSNKKAVKVFNPRLATIRSAMVPGWGQIYNKKYWKLPLVYGALGTTAGVFIYNVKNYKLLRLAYLYKSDTISSNDVLIDPKFKNLSANSIKVYRNSFRQNVDYSVLFFIIFWGLNVVDATVDAQLKGFDVNDNVTMQLTPGYSPLANTTGVSLVFNIHSKVFKGVK